MAGRASTLAAAVGVEAGHLVEDGGEHQRLAVRGLEFAALAVVGDEGNLGTVTTILKGDADG